MRESIYGNCDRCNSQLEPIWFTEYEYETYGGTRVKTGRKRKSVSHLICPNCMKNYIVGDSYDGSWHY